MTVSPTATATPASSIFRNACPRTSPSKNGIVCAPAHMSDIVDGGACCSRQKSAAEERGGAAEDNAGQRKAGRADLQVGCEADLAIDEMVILMTPPVYLC